MQFNDNQPIWLQIYDHACRAIVSGPSGSASPRYANSP